MLLEFSLVVPSSIRPQHITEAGTDPLTFSNWRLWLGVGVSGVFLIFLALTIELDELFRALKEANYLFVVPAVFIYFAGVYFRAARWRYILSPLRSITAARLFPVVVIGYAANNVLPARVGELVRAYYLAQREKFSGSTALATIGVERIYDGLTLFMLSVTSALLLLLLGTFEDVDEVYRGAALVLAGIAGVGLVLGLALVTFVSVNSNTMRFVDRIISLLPGRFRPRIRELAVNFIRGLSILNSPRQHVIVGLHSLPVWVCEMLVYLTIAYSFGINDYFDNGLVFVLAMALVTATSNLSTAFPVSIGGIGPFELIAQQTLVIVGVDGSVAASYALVVHLVALWLPVNLAGLVLMWRENLSLKQLSTSGEEVAPAQCSETEAKERHR